MSRDLGFGVAFISVSTPPPRATRAAARVAAVPHDERAIEQALKRPPAGPVHLVPFVPAGFPTPDATTAAVKALADAGAAVIEIGIPFSDPVADGPAIQAAYHESLTNGTTLAGTLERLGGVLPELKTPALAMVSYSVVHRRGPAEFCRLAKAAGLSGVLCPDLPPPEAQGFCDTAKDAGLEPILLVAPTTPPHRRDLIGQIGGGFVYYLSVAGTTGERDRLPPELADGVADMRSRTDLPVCVGFGVSRASHLRELAGVAQGAIVGTALVRRMDAARDGGPDAVGRACGDLARELLGGAP